MAPENLVVVGLYRFVRNPMYVGVITLVAGWSIFFRSPVLLFYAIALLAALHIRVVADEEPWLAAQFGDEWGKYRRQVNRWLPSNTVKS